MTLDKLNFYSSDEVFIPVSRTSDKVGLVVVSVILSVISYHMLQRSVQVALLFPFLMFLMFWFILIKDLAKNKRGLIINKKGITYIPVMFKPKKERNGPLVFEWEEIDKFEIDEEINTPFLKISDIKVYIKGDNPKNKIEKFFVDMVTKIPNARIDRSIEIKRLKADIPEVKKLLDKRLAASRVNQG